MLRAILLSTLGVVLIGFIAVGCDRGSSNSANPGTPSRVAQGETYHSADDTLGLKLISSTECELTSNGRTLICKYTAEPEALRIVASGLGLTEVVYLQFVPRGLAWKDRGLLLSPKEYAAEKALVSRGDAASGAPAASASQAARAPTTAPDPANAVTEQALIGTWKFDEAGYSGQLVLAGNQRFHWTTTQAADPTWSEREGNWFVSSHWIPREGKKVQNLFLNSHPYGASCRMTGLEKDRVTIQLQMSTGPGPSISMTRAADN